MAFTILLVDDNVSLRRYCGEELEADGFRILHAGDGVEALSIVANRRPDIVILDLRLPRLSGSEVVGRIREMDAALPVILHTASPGDWGRGSGLPCVPKSADLTPLRRAIADALCCGQRPAAGAPAANADTPRTPGPSSVSFSESFICQEGSLRYASAQPPLR